MLTDQLTRQNEDLKETKERLRGEIATAANALQRRERMLQGTPSILLPDLPLGHESLTEVEVLERARKAESEAASYASNQKDLEKSTKKALAEMKIQLEEAQRKEAKAGSETTALREGVKAMKETWTRELKAVRAEMKVAEEQLKRDAADTRAKNTALVKLTQDQA